MSPPFTRRNAIIAAVSAGVLGIAGGIGLRALRPQTDEIAKRIAYALPERASVEILGPGAYSAIPGLRLDYAVNEIASRLGIGRDELQQMRIPDIRARLERAFVRDAIARDVVRMDGWIVARSLALACAIAYSADVS